jgi:hypothetical protein
MEDVRTEARPREAVGVFQDEASLRAAADALLIAGFDRSSLSLLAGRARVEAKLGHPCDDVAELEDDPGVPTRHYVGCDSRIEGEAAIIGVLVYVSAILAAGVTAAAGGTTIEALIATVIVGAVAGLAGLGLVRGLERRRRRNLMEQIERGGIPLWVRATDPEHERRALEILRESGAGHVHAHEMPATVFVLKGGESHQLSFMRALGL